MGILFYIISFVLIISSFLIGLLLGLNKTLKPEDYDFEPPKQALNDSDESIKALFSKTIQRVKEELMQDELFSRFHAHELKNAIHNMDGVIATSTSLPSTEKQALKSGIEGIRHSLNTFLKINCFR